MEEDEGEQLDDQPMYDRPVGPNISKGFRYSKKRGEYYDSLEGLRKWREAGGRQGPRKDKIMGVQSKDTVDYGSLLEIVSQQGNMIKKMLKKGNKMN